MTNPAGSSGLVPGLGGVTNDGSVPAQATNTQSNVITMLQNNFSSKEWPSLNSALVSMLTSFITSGLSGILGGFTTTLDAILGTVNTSYVTGLLSSLLGDITNIPAAIDSAISSLIGSLTSGGSVLSDAETWANSIVSDITATIQGITGTTTPSNVAPVVSGIQSNLIAATTAISNLQVGQSGSAAGGISLTDSFPTVGALSSDPSWSVLGQNLGSGVDLHVKAAGDLGITGSPSATGTRFALNTTPMATDNGVVNLVAFNKGNVDANSMIIVRAAPDMSKFVYANIFQNTAYLGYATWDGNPAHAAVYNDWNPGGTTIDQEAGNQLSLSFTATTYEILNNSTAIVGHTDSAGNAPIDSSHRCVGLGIAVNSLFGSYYDGWDIASFSASDTGTPTYLGTGWLMTRVNTATVNTPGSGQQLLGAGTLDTTNILANVTAVDTAGLGGVQIQRSGWYIITLALTSTSSASDTNAFIPLLWIRAAHLTDSLVLRRVGGWSSADANNCVTTFCEYLVAGNILYPGMQYTGGTPGVIGDAAGVKTYWSATLSNA